MRTAARRALLAALLLVLAAGASFTFYGGRFLQHDDPLQKADAILMLGGARAERCLEAYELYKAGYAPVVVLSPGRIEQAEVLLRDRGIRLPLEVDLQRDLLRQLGVPNERILTFPVSVDNTAEEAEALHDLARARGWRRVIVVTSKYHTRRSRFGFRREFAGSGTEIIVRSSRFDPSDPAHWWRARPDVRFVLEEWGKLVAYRFGLRG
jgi:uncharacterized SAM-binding protein YcdF (DUF218 family)